MGATRVCVRSLVGISFSPWLSPNLLIATAYAFDATTIDLCLSLFPWATFRRRKGAIKLHTLLEIHSAIPVFIAITAGDVHEVNLLDELTPEPGSFIIMDSGFTDCRRGSPSLSFAPKAIWPFAVVILIPTTALPECAATKPLS